MLCLSIKQPWIELILQGLKTIEIRYWRRVEIPRIPFTIGLHSPGSFDWGAAEHLMKTAAWPFIKDLSFDRLADEHGAIIGTAELTKIKVIEDAEDFNKLCGHHYNEELTADDFKAMTYKKTCLALHLCGVERLKKPVPFVGRLGFFDAKVPGLQGEETRGPSQQEFPS